MAPLIEYLKQNPTLDLVSDSRNVTQNSIFFAIQGVSHDGHDHIPSAVKNKCQVLVVNLGRNQSWAHLGFTGLVFEVEDTKAEWVNAWRFRCDYPDEKLFVAGVTGTNGKTSTVHMLEHILNKANLPCGVIGTIDSHLGFKKWPSPLTTPGPDILFPQLKSFVQAKAKASALEISSHGLHQKRLQGLQLDVAIFSNLTQDHLDYHKTMQEYFLAKELIFTDILEKSKKKNKVAVINLMDDNGFKVDVPTNVKTYYYYENSTKTTKLQDKIKNFLADKRQLNPEVFGCEIKILKSDQQNSEFEISVADLDLQFKLPLVGKFQIFNWVQSVLAVLDKVNDPRVLKEAAQSFLGIPGRMQKIVLPLTDKNIFVDYAHTPDALDRALASLRPVTNGQLIVVFGCGGDRDQSKRPLMARVAENYADQIIVTNDNPRTESPEAIASQILEGFKKQSPKVILDRSQAIQYGCSRLESKNDVLLIAGKGHEDYQIIGHEKKYFSDYDEVVKLFVSSH